jgi:hypothetical protein
MTVTLASYENAPVRTRKPHLCAYCGEVIPAGAKGTRRESGIDDSEGPFRRYVCVRCVPYIWDFWDYVGDDVADLRDWFRQYMNEQHPGWRERVNKRAMISQPMAGKTDEEIAEARDRAHARLREMGYEFVNTLFTDEWYSAEAMKERGVVQVPLCYLAKSLENMSLCHAAYFCKGWEKARGCRIEHDAAVAYGLEVLYED